MFLSHYLPTGETVTVDIRVCDDATFIAIVDLLVYDGQHSLVLKARAVRALSAHARAQ